MQLATKKTECRSHSVRHWLHDDEAAKKCLSWSCSLFYVLLEAVKPLESSSLPARQVAIMFTEKNLELDPQTNHFVWAATLLHSQNSRDSDPQ